uniref:Toxoplasma gondii family B protein n=1 Tax=Neospora caninum (strain Liverpool) TaxID=572307 RepID=A0A0F7UCJ3_NEOCL|nr:TPA: hypothetical protein BN1204_019375 [Neospora caninum Liverpool]
MMVNSSSTAAVVFLTFSLHPSHIWCNGSRVMTTGVLDFVPVMTSGDNGSDAASAVSSSAISAEGKQQRIQVGRLPKRPRRRIPAEGRTLTLPRTQKVIPVTVGVLLTAVLGLLLASVKLHQCRQQLLKNADGQTEGNTKRRLAEGGSGDSSCVSLAPASMRYRSPRLSFIQRTTLPPTLHSSRRTCRHNAPSIYWAVTS